MKLAITGHRPNKLNNEYNLNGPLTKWLKGKILEVIKSESPDEIITGMALGVDQLFALIGIELRMKVNAYIPCHNQERMWPKSSKDLYKKILDNPLVSCKYIYDGEYTNSCMQNRNIAMVHDCDKIIAVYDGSSGGTGNCFKSILKANKPHFLIDPKDFYEQI